MNLLEATTTLIDAAKTYAPEQDRLIVRAVKRMEKRLAVLQLRAAKALKRNRLEAWYQALMLLGRVIADDHKTVLLPCKGCQHPISFGEFCKGVVFTGRGDLVSLTCPECGCLMEKEAA